MSTDLQVTASTQQAVGAFNALAQSIANATQQFNNMNTAMGRGTQQATRYSGQVTAINSAFNSLVHMLSGAAGLLARVGAGVEYVFSSIIKELDKLQGFNAIMSVTTKSADAVSASYDFLRKTADRLGVQFDSLTGNYAKLVASLPQGAKGLEIAQKVFLGIADAARTLHASNQDTQLMFYAVTQMASKGVISMEELRRQLGEKLPGVMQIAAKALNTLPETLEAAIRKGIVVSEKFLPIFGDALIRTFGDSAEVASQSVSASINRLTNVWVDFVKQILDSGAGKSIANVFDAIREKLSDPYVIERFAQLVKNLADRFTEFITKLTQDDLRNGFDAFSHAVEAGVTIVQKLVELLQWVINNGKTAGAIIGGLLGASAGIVAGPWGMAVGGALGAAGGAYAGSSLTPSASELSQRQNSDAAAQLAASMKRQEQEMIKFTQLIPLLQQFKGLNGLAGLDNLFKAENLNTRTIEDLNKILSNPKTYRTDSDRAQAVRDYAKFGTLLAPSTSKLSDVLGPSKKADKSLMASELHAFGLNSNFRTEMGNYNKLLASGKLNMEQYTDAVQKLIQKQPYMIEYQKLLRKEQEGENKALTDFITFTIGAIEAKEKMRQSLDDELRLAGMRGDALRIEEQVTQYLNQLREKGATLTAEENAQLRDRLKIIDQTRQVTQAEQSLLAGTVDNRRQFDNQLTAFQNLASNPPAGMQQGDSAKMLMQMAPDLFEGTQIQLDAQVAAFADMYSRIQKLRDADVINETTASQLRARVAIDESRMRLKNTSDFFSNLATLSSLGNKRLAAIGKAAAVTQATIDGVLAVQKALAAPPGWPYNAANVIAVGIAQAANVAKIAGFEEGGYTGNGGTSAIAGVVHGQEFVTNAAATRRNRAVLEAMNAGATVTPSGANVQVFVQNNVAGAQARVTEQDTAEGRRIEVVIEETVIKSVRKGGRIAETFESQYNLNRAVGTSR